MIWSHLFPLGFYFAAMARLRLMWQSSYSLFHLAPAVLRSSVDLLKHFAPVCHSCCPRCWSWGWEMWELLGALVVVVLLMQWGTIPIANNEVIQSIQLTGFAFFSRCSGSLAVNSAVVSIGLFLGTALVFCSHWPSEKDNDAESKKHEACVENQYWP